MPTVFLLLLLFAIAAPTPVGATGDEKRVESDRLILVARDSIEDVKFRRQLEKVGGPKATRFVLALSEKAELPGVDRCFAPKSRTVPLDRELCRRLAEVDVLVIRGGTFMQWYETLFPDDGATYLERTLRERVRSRKTIVAYGGACAFMCSGTSIPKKDLDEVERNPREKNDHQVARVAMGLGPEALIDSDDFPDGSPRRLIRALKRTHVDLGYHLVGDVALDYRREEDEVYVLGPGSVLVVDLSRARRGKRAVREGRLSLLREGDGWDEGFEIPFLSSKRHPVQKRGERHGTHLATGPVLQEATALAKLMEDLAHSEWARTTSGDRRDKLELRWDPRSQVHGKSPDLTLLWIAFDHTWE